MRLITVILFSLSVLGCCGQTPANDQHASAVSKNILIVGDSISMGYTQYVARNLEGFYNVRHVSFAPGVNSGMDQNAQGTSFTLANLDRWLAQSPHLDVIVWNNGLWNARDPALDPQAPGNATDLVTYEAELRLIAAKLKATGARVIFFGTTEIPLTGSTFIPGRELDENLVAGRVMADEQIEFYELRPLSVQNPKLHHTDDGIHFNTQGYSLFGEFIADMIRADYEASN